MLTHIASAFCAALCLLLMFGVHAHAADAPSVASMQVGLYQINLLSEGQRESETSLLIGASEASIKQYIPTGKFATAVNAFLVRTPDNIVLIDTGFGKKLFDNMKSLGVIPEHVDVVLLTHMHMDHIGGLLVDGKAAFPNAKLCLAEQERAYWTDAGIMGKASPARQQNFKLAQEVLRVYGENVWTFSPPALSLHMADLLPGIKAIAAFGHTPGHTVFQVGSDKAGALIWGDLTHAMAIQMPKPEVAMTYDVNPNEAVASRLQIMQYVTQRDFPVAGMHIPFPGMGKLSAKIGGGYAFTPTPQ